MSGDILAEIRRILQPPVILFRPECPEDAAYRCDTADRRVLVTHPRHRAIVEEAILRGGLVADTRTEDSDARQG